jgi:hypothetical protein
VGTIVEDRRERLALAEDAGLGPVSGTSVLAGILVGYGAFAVLAGLAAAGLRAVNVDVNLTGDSFRQTGTAGGIALGVVLFVAWWFGAYVAGRMARRAGVKNGFMVFLFGLLIAVAAAAVVRASGVSDEVANQVRSLGVPTSADQWRQIGTVAGIASLLGMLLGSLLGGSMGERWHSKLLTRALDPAVGPEAMARAAQPKVLRAEERRHGLSGDGGRPPADEIDITDRPARRQRRWSRGRMGRGTGPGRSDVREGGRQAPAP